MSQINNNNGGGGGGGGGVTSLNSETGAITLTSSGMTVDITTPDANTINLEVAGGGGGTVVGDPVTNGVHNDVLYVDGSGNLANDDNFTWDDSSTTFMIGQNGTNQLLKVSQQSSVLEIGDRNAIGGADYMTIDWGTSENRLHTDGNFKIASSITPSNAFFSIDVAGARYFLGDGDNAIGGPSVVLDGTGVTTNVGSGTTITETIASSGGLYIVQDNTAAQYLNIAPGSSVAFGNLATGNSAISFDLTGGGATGITTIGVFSVGNAGSNVIQTDSSTFSFLAGDASGVNAYLNIDGNTQNIDLRTGGNIAFATNDGSGARQTLVTNTMAQSISIGALYGATPTTLHVETGVVQTTGALFTVEDRASHLGLSVDPINLIFAAGDVSNHANGTKLIVDDSTMLVTITNVPAYLNDAAATGAGLTSGQLYQSTTLGITALNIVP